MTKKTPGTVAYQPAFCEFGARMRRSLCQVVVVGKWWVFFLYFRYYSERVLPRAIRVQAALSDLKVDEVIGVTFDVSF